MNKSNFITIATAIVSLLFVACNNNVETPVASVQVHVNNFTISQEDFEGPQKAPAAEQPITGYSGVKAITLAFYQDATEVVKITQLRNDATTYTTFGDFSYSLPMGSYTMVVIGHGLNDGEPAITLTSPTSATFGDYPARETFVNTQTVNITNTAAVNISATLSRVVAKLQVQSSDTRTNPAYSVRMTFAAGGKSLNPTTGLAADNTGFSNAVTISTAVGATSLSNSYLFLATDEQTMDVTIETLDEDGNSLYSKTVENVPFKRNRVTILTGAVYTNSSISGAFRVEDTWLSNYNANF